VGIASPNALKDKYEEMGGRMAANPDMDLASLRNILDELHQVASEPTGVTYEEVDANGVPAVLVKPVDAADDRIIIYSHGGGCVAGSVNSHRKMAGHLAKAAGTHALVLEYRLAPENPFPAQIDDMVSGHRWARANGYTPEHTATAGDSAGGNLAITTVLKLRELGEPLPAAMVGFSPWIDMELKGESLKSNADSDALVQPAVLEGMAQMYLGGASPSDPLANPLHADVSGLPPMFLNAGEAETLLDDARRFADRAKEAGCDVTVETAPGHQHVYVFMAGKDKDADATISNAAQWLRPKLGL
jgi:monoterpene epsilon-lactone hydrolase